MPPQESKDCAPCAPKAQGSVVYETSSAPCWRSRNMQNAKRSVRLMPGLTTADMNADRVALRNGWAGPSSPAGRADRLWRRKTYGPYLGLKRKDAKLIAIEFRRRFIRMPYNHKHTTLAASPPRNQPIADATLVRYNTFHCVAIYTLAPITGSFRRICETQHLRQSNRNGY